MFKLECNLKNALKNDYPVYAYYLYSQYLTIHEGSGGGRLVGAKKCQTEHLLITQQMLSPQHQKLTENRVHVEKELEPQPHNQSLTGDYRIANLHKGTNPVNNFCPTTTSNQSKKLYKIKSALI